MTLSAIRPELCEVPIAAIREPRLMSRNAVNEDHVVELAASMRQQGFTSAIVLARVDDGHEIIAGHHRWLAAQRVGLAALPALVYPSYFDGIEAIQQSENSDRKPAGPADEAVWYSELLEKRPDEGTDGLAVRVGRTRNYVEGRLALLHGDPRVFEALAGEQINIGVATELNRCGEELHRRYLLDLAIRTGATVGVARQWVHEWKTIHAPAAGMPIDTATVAAGGPSLNDEYFTCRVCGERDNTANMRPVNVHDYCLRPLIDPRTGIFKSKAEYVEFPRTREEALRLMQRVLDRFPELAGEGA